MVVPRRACKASKPSGESCRAAVLRDGEFCFWHDPEHAQDAEEARKLGGQRRRRERIVAGAYDVESLDSVADLRRLLIIGAINLVDQWFKPERGSLTPDDLIRQFMLVLFEGMTPSGAGKT